MTSGFGWGPVRVRPMASTARPQWIKASWEDTLSASSVVIRVGVPGRGFRCRITCRRSRTRCFLPARGARSRLFCWQDRLARSARAISASLPPTGRTASLSSPPAAGVPRLGDHRPRPGLSAPISEARAIRVPPVLVACSPFFYCSVTCPELPVRSAGRRPSAVPVGPVT